MSERFDVAIAGAGPAGSAAAITAARRGLTTLLVDKSRFPRDKVCGSFVSAEAVSAAENLLDTSLERFPALHEVTLTRGERAIRRSLDHPARSVSRAVLDHELVKAAERSGVVVRLGESVTHVLRVENGFHIVTETNTYVAAAVIDASGRWSRVRAAEGTPSERLIGVKQSFTQTNAGNSVDLYFFDGGYCGVQPIGEGQVNVSALVKPERARSVEGIWMLCPALRRRSDRWAAANAPLFTYPLYFDEPAAVVNGVARAGDAAAFIDPFLGDGISIALHSGMAAADSLGTSDGWLHYQQWYEQTVIPVIRRSSRLRRFTDSRVAWNLLALPGAVTAIERLTRLHAA